MKLLYDLKENKEKVIEDTNRAIDDCSLTEEEELRLEELSIQIERITNRISEMASREPSRNDSIYDATMRQLMYEQEILQIEYEGLDENKQEGIYLKNNLEEFLEYLDEINEPTDDFRTDIFLNTVEKGIIYDNHRVEFKFKCGTSYTTWAKRKRNK